ncbi:MAG: phosphodiester glycosidase family protein [Oscillospiraceae bacterium]|jgi:exopolysaccharide biosynthesis protein|nr:phosphodiester glycosidase family protein [Oscillospiraceae bacterium]
MTQQKSGGLAFKVIRRFLFVLFIALLFALVSVYTLLRTVVNGPSETVRDMLVLSAKQASATKWLPGLFMNKKLVEQIEASSHEVNVEEINPDDYAPAVAVTKPGDGNAAPADPWENAIDGMRFETVSGATFKAYVLLVRDPSRIYVATSSDYKSGKAGSRIYEVGPRDGAIAGINGGEFEDTGGTGNGALPFGLTYSQGNCVWNDGSKRTFIGIDRNDRLFVANSMTKAAADEMGIRDAVSFQTDNVLIKEEDGKVSAFYADDNNGTAQRTAVGQARDGTFILIVTDGRTASSIGATPNDIVDLMLSYGAVNAGMLDGGSSAMMYYENYYSKYKLDESMLDKYQKLGIVNKYKAFTDPRRMPTFFMVRPE